MAKFWKKLRKPLQKIAKVAAPIVGASNPIAGLALGQMGKKAQISKNPLVNLGLDLGGALYGGGIGKGLGGSLPDFGLGGSKFAGPIGDLLGASGGASGYAGTIGSLAGMLGGGGKTAQPSKGPVNPYLALLGIEDSLKNRGQAGVAGEAESPLSAILGMLTKTGEAIQGGQPEGKTAGGFDKDMWRNIRGVRDDVFGEGQQGQVLGGLAAAGLIPALFGGLKDLFGGGDKKGPSGPPVPSPAPPMQFPGGGYPGGGYQGGGGGGFDINFPVPEIQPYLTTGARFRPESLPIEAMQYAGNRMPFEGRLGQAGRMR